MRKPITVNTIEELKSVAFDYNAPVFVGPDILISEFISTDDECDKLIEKLEHYHKSVIAFCFSHDGFRVHFLLIDNFVVLKKYGIELLDNQKSQLIQKIKDTKVENPPCESDASAETVRSYFGTLLPNYDKDKVLIGDMKKVIKWFNFLEARGFLDATEPVVEAEIVE